jgi:hypothetical protein
MYMMVKSERMRGGENCGDSINDNPRRGLHPNWSHWNLPSPTYQGSLQVLCNKLDTDWRRLVSTLRPRRLGSLATWRHDVHHGRDLGSVSSSIGGIPADRAIAMSFNDAGLLQLEVKVFSNV